MRVGEPKLWEVGNGKPKSLKISDLFGGSPKESDKVYKTCGSHFLLEKYLVFLTRKKKSETEVWSRKLDRTDQILYNTEIRIQIEDVKSFWLISKESEKIFLLSSCSEYPDDLSLCRLKKFLFFICFF